MRRSVPAFLTLLCLMFPLRAAAAPAVTYVTQWRVKEAPHFRIYYDDQAPGSIALEAEKLYGKLRLGVAMFAPWMTREKVRIYIYGCREAYLGGEFKPPQWSKGLAYFSSKTVVVYYGGDMPKLRAVIAHELSHLYFESYYGERLKYPPVWLNEGLAVMMEELSYDGEGPWTLALKYGDGGKFQPMDAFFGSDPARLSAEADIGYWYLQAYGVVSYLYRPRKRLQFRDFCSLLRDGEQTGQALWKSYRLNGPGDLQAEWSQWLASFRNGDPHDLSSDAASGGFTFKPVQFRQFGLNDPASAR